MRTMLILAVVGVLAVASYTASRLHERLQPPDDEVRHQAEGTDATEDGGPVDAPVHVRVERLRRGMLPAESVALGTVVPGPDQREAVCVASELQVVHLLVSTGDPVHAGMPVAEGKLTAEGRSARLLALSERDQARIALDSARERLARQLGTRQELEQAEQALAASEPKAAMWEAQGDGSMIALLAGRTGTVEQVMAHDGQVLASGSVVCEIIGPGLEARLGFEPALSGSVHPGDSLGIRLTQASLPVNMSCPVRAVSHVIDPESRLLDVLVTIPDGAAPLGALVRGELSVATPAGWLVSRAAVGATDTHDTLFTIVDGVAHEHQLTVVAAAGELMSISAGDLAAGDVVVILGNAELHDGSAVIVDR